MEYGHVFCGGGGGCLLFTWRPVFIFWSHLSLPDIIVPQLYIQDSSFADCGCGRDPQFREGGSSCKAFRVMETFLLRKSHHLEKLFRLSLLFFCRNYENKNVTTADVKPPFNFMLVVRRFLRRKWSIRFDTARQASFKWSGKFLCRFRSTISKSWNSSVEGGLRTEPSPRTGYRAVRLQELLYACVSHRQQWGVCTLHPACPRCIGSPQEWCPSACF